MSVKVVHPNPDLNSQFHKTTKFSSNSWTITEGHLTVGDSYGSPEASFAPNFWFEVVKVEVEEEVDED